MYVFVQPVAVEMEATSVRRGRFSPILASPTPLMRTVALCDVCVNLCPQGLLDWRQVWGEGLGRGGVTLQDGWTTESHAIIDIQQYCSLDQQDLNVRTYMHI